MKKTVKYILSVFAVTVLLTSCQSKKASIKKHPVTLRFAENHVSTYPTSLADMEFARIVEEKTGGRIKIEVRTGGALTETTDEAIEAIKNGDIAFTRISSTPLTSYVPEYSALQLPYLYRSSTHMWNVLNGKIGQSLLDKIERSGSGLVGLCYYDAGSRNFYATREIRSVADMKDLRVRVSGAVMVDMCEVLGAVPVTGIGMSDVRNNIESGNIDAAENNWPTYQSTGDYGVAKYFVLDQHTRVPEMVVASKKALARLSDEEVQIIRDAAKAAQAYEIQKWSENEKKSEKIVRANGNVVIELTEQRKDEFQKAMQPLYDKYASQYKSLIREIQSVN